MRLRRSRDIPSSGSMLMLTPMLDVLTVVLIFLILNYSPDTKKLEVSDSVSLPKADIKMKEVPRVRVEVTKTSFKINGSLVEGLTAESTDRNLWEAVKTKVLSIVGEGSSEPILLVADAETPYDTVDRTVARLASLGFSDVYLLTQLEDKK